MHGCPCPCLCSLPCGSSGRMRKTDLDGLTARAVQSVVALVLLLFGRQYNHCMDRPALLYCHGMNRPPLPLLGDVGTMGFIVLLHADVRFRRLRRAGYHSSLCLEGCRGTPRSLAPDAARTRHHLNGCVGRAGLLCHVAVTASDETTVTSHEPPAPADPSCV